jgi:hypothetical protein
MASCIRRQQADRAEPSGDPGHGALAASGITCGDPDMGQARRGGRRGSISPHTRMVAYARLVPDASNSFARQKKFGCSPPRSSLWTRSFCRLSSKATGPLSGRREPTVCSVRSESTEAARRARRVKRGLTGRLKGLVPSEMAHARPHGIWGSCQPRGIRGQFRWTVVSRWVRQRLRQAPLVAASGCARSQLRKAHIAGVSRRDFRRVSQ